MSRYDSGDFTGGLIGGVLLAAVLLIALIGILLVYMCRELVTIFATRAFTGTRSAKVLWIALACLIGALVLAGLLAMQPHTVEIGIFLACWATFLFTIVSVWVDASERRKEVPVEMPELSLSDVVSWRKASDATMQGMNNRSNAA